MADLSRLDFEQPDLHTFPLIGIAREAVRCGSTYPTVLSAADTIAVNAFLNQRISFLEIAFVVQSTLDAHVVSNQVLDLDTILDADRWATGYASVLTGMSSTA